MSMRDVNRQRRAAAARNRFGSFCCNRSFALGNAHCDGCGTKLRDKQYSTGVISWCNEPGCRDRVLEHFPGLHRGRIFSPRVNGAKTQVTEGISHHCVNCGQPTAVINTNLRVGLCL